MASIFFFQIVKLKTSPKYSHYTVVLLKLDKLRNQQSLLKTIVEKLKSTGSRINWQKFSYNGENLQQYGIIHFNLHITICIVVLQSIYMHMPLVIDITF